MTSPITRQRWQLISCLLVAAAPLLAQSPQTPSDDVPRKLLTDSHVAWRKAQFASALTLAVQVEHEHGGSAVAPDAYLAASRALVGLGDWASAMEELQHILSNVWPATPEPALKVVRDQALADLTVLARVYPRAPWPAIRVYAKSDTVGQKLEHIRSLAGSDNATYWLGENTRGALPAGAALLPVTPKPRGLTLDASRNPVIIDEDQLTTLGGKSMRFEIRKPGKPKLEPLGNLTSAVQTWATRDWLVLSDDQSGLHRFGADGSYKNPTEPGENGGAGPRLSHLAISPFDEVVGINNDEGSIVFLDGTGKVTGSKISKDLRDLKDVAFDAFGHLYVLGQRTIWVFSPYRSPGANAPAVPPPGTPARAPGPVARSRGDEYVLRISFSEPEKAPGFHNAVSFALDRSGNVYLYDESLKQILVYR